MVVRAVPRLIVLCAMTGTTITATNRARSIRSHWLRNIGDDWASSSNTGTSTLVTRTFRATATGSEGWAAIVEDERRAGSNERTTTRARTRARGTGCRVIGPCLSGSQPTTLHKEQGRR